MLKGRSDMTGKFIGATAKEFGLNPRTLRYYETLHLLPTPTRSDGGYRIYDEEAARRLGFIINAKSLGLTLKEIRQIVMIGGSGRLPCTSVQRILREHVRRVDHQLAQLRALKADLQTMLARCRRPREDEGGMTRQKIICPVIETLEAHLIWGTSHREGMRGVPGTGGRVGEKMCFS
jgi:DNA-binding transcriptional MerR regulator